MSVDTSHSVAERNTAHHFVRWLMNRVGKPRLAIRFWDGQEFLPDSEHPVATVEFRTRRAFLSVMRSPSIGFGECYANGSIEIHGDIASCVNEITAAIARKSRSRYYVPKFRSFLTGLQLGSISRSRQNVHRHYDLGNDFYRLWLDERMVYTCAYYETAEMSLASAQAAKLEHICRKLRLQPGQRVVEAGCGWGALAHYMAKYYDVEVVAYNNSSEQVTFAKERAKTEGLSNRVTFVEDDYRNIDATCDAFVSIGMLEHVGLANFRALGSLVKRCLSSDGIGLIHTIGRSHPQAMDPWIVKHIFPGGHVPSLSEMMSVFEPHRFSIIDVENLRLHYARTCTDWLRNFDEAADKVREKYGTEFVRMWRLYLAGSSAGFRFGTLQLYQVLFAPAENNNVPLTRAYQYPKGQVGE